MDEFKLIQKYFMPATSNTLLGVGDDAALIQPSAYHILHVSTDMLIAGRHFFHDVDPMTLGHKALAVNLSDLAAMGATPRWALLSLALPTIDEDWVANLSRGFLLLAQQHQVDLIGGDTNQGPLALSVTIIGETPGHMALRRTAAHVGDDIWVSGELGLAALALHSQLGTLPPLAASLHQVAWQQLTLPEPRVALGQSLLTVAHAAIDLSDGLLADLQHITEASQVGAEIWADTLPSHPDVEARRSEWIDYIANGGDDYELAFTASATARSEVMAYAQQHQCRLTRIGRIVQTPHIHLLDNAGQPIELKRRGYNHFAPS